MIGPGQIVEILFRSKDAHAPVIDIEKILKVAELIGRSYLRHRFEGQGKIVMPGLVPQHLRLQSAFDVNMELDLGQSFDKRSETRH